MTSLPREVPVRTAPARPLTLLSSGYWFAGFLLLSLFAFWPTYFSKLPARMDIYTHVHAVLMTLWFALLIAQPFLIRGGRRIWHRVFGRFSYVLVPAITVTWVQLVHARASAMPDEVFAREGKYFYLPFVSALAFLAAWTMAIARRRITPLHARYMVCTAFALIDAVTARILFFNFPPFENPVNYQVIGFGLTEALIVTLLLIDRGPNRRAFLHMLIVFGSLHVFCFTIGQTSAWLEAVRWFRGLPLT